MDVSKEGLIERLLRDGKITKDEAVLLRRKEVDITPVENEKVFPYDFPVINTPNPNDWVTQEFNRRQRIAERCGCNPANGGSGVCGCTLTGPVIYS